MTRPSEKSLDVAPLDDDLLSIISELKCKHNNTTQDLGLVSTFMDCMFGQNNKKW